MVEHSAWIRRLGVDVPLGRDTFCFTPLDIFVKNIRSWVQNECCCLSLLIFQIDDFVQDCSNSSANALELLQSCTKPSKCTSWCWCDACAFVGRRGLCSQMLIPLLSPSRLRPSYVDCSVSFCSSCPCPAQHGSRQTGPVKDYGKNVTVSGMTLIAARMNTRVRFLCPACFILYWTTVFCNCCCCFN